MDRVDKVPTQDKYDKEIEVVMNLDKTIVKLSELNGLAYKDFILSINTSSAVEKVGFGLVRNVKSPEILKGNYKMTWDWLISEYLLPTAFFLLKLRHAFYKSNLN